MFITRKIFDFNKFCIGKVSSIVFFFWNIIKNFLLKTKKPPLIQFYLIEFFLQIYEQDFFLLSIHQILPEV